MLGEETKSDRTASGKGWNPRPMIGKENEKGLCDQSGKAGKAGRCSAKSGRMKPEAKLRSGCAVMEARGVETSEKATEGCSQSAR